MPETLINWRFSEANLKLMHESFQSRGIMHAYMIFKYIYMYILLQGYQACSTNCVRWARHDAVLNRTRKSAEPMDDGWLPQRMAAQVANTCCRQYLAKNSAFLSPRWGVAALFASFVTFAQILPKTANGQGYDIFSRAYIGYYCHNNGIEPTWFVMNPNKEKNTKIIYLNVNKWLGSIDLLSLFMPLVTPDWTDVQGESVFLRKGRLSGNITLIPYKIIVWIHLKPIKSLRVAKRRSI